MGIFDELMEGVDDVTDALDAHNKAAKEFDNFQKKFKRLIDKYAPNKNAKRSAKRALDDLREAILDDIMGTPPIFGGMEKYYNKYGGRNVDEMAALITQRLNNRYNYKDTDDAVWVDLKVKFYQYNYKNKNEITELKRLESKANSLQAEQVAQKAEELRQELVKEGNYLDKLISEIKPENYKRGLFRGRKREGNFHDDYYDTEILLEGQISLYQKGGRTSLLSAYNKYLENLKGDPDRVNKAILLVDKDLGKQETLEEKTQAAQALREKPEREAVYEGREEYVEALRKKLDLEASRRTAFNRSILER